VSGLAPEKRRVACSRRDRYLVLDPVHEGQY
jgi:hypothetical protein